jgi:hypothetical protein
MLRTKPLQVFALRVSIRAAVWKVRFFGLKAAMLKLAT